MDNNVDTVAYPESFMTLPCMKMGFRLHDTDFTYGETMLRIFADAMSGVLAVAPTNLLPTAWMLETESAQYFCPAMPIERIHCIHYRPDTDDAYIAFLTGDEMGMAVSMITYINMSKLLSSHIDETNWQVLGPLIEETNRLFTQLNLHIHKQAKMAQINNLIYGVSDGKWGEIGPHQPCVEGNGKGQYCH